MKKFFKIFVMIVCLIPMVGLGLCGLWTVGAGLRFGSDKEVWLYIPLGLLSIFFSVAFGAAAHMLFESIKKTAPDEKPPAS